ncbi:MAG TPA: FtsX-like permease family protein [Gammaproteobacteria bacterium]
MLGNSLAQIGAVTVMNLRNIRERLSSTLVALFGVTGVVTVVVGVLSINEGFRAVLQRAGADDVVVVLRGGATDEMTSGFGQDATRVIADAAQIARDGSRPLASSELYVIVDVAMKSKGTPAYVPLRGVTAAAAPELRQDFEITEGRMFTPGTFEIIVGRGAASEFAGLEVGQTLQAGTTAWNVVGHFRDRGSIAESEIWTDAPVLQGVYNRGTSYQSVRARLTSAQAFQAFKDGLTADPRLNVRVFTERQYYEEQSRTMTAIVGSVGVVIAVLMGLGAIFAAVNTMYSAVSARAREIATLRALGFGRFPIVVSVLVEAALIGVVGGAIGMAIAYFAFNGLQASTLNWTSFSQITFAFTVTPELAARGMVYALALGLLGGLFPSFHAAKQPIVRGLREL